MRRLSDRMRDALTAAARNDGLRRIHDDKPGRPPWPAPHQTLHALERRGMLARTTTRTREGFPVDTWRITDAGRAALNPPARHRQDFPHFLQRNVWRGGDYTTDPRRSIDVDHQAGHRPQAIEALVTPADLTRYAEASAERRTSTLKQAGKDLDQRPYEQRLDRAARIARERHVDVYSELRLIRFMHRGGRIDQALARLTALEARLAQRAAA